MLVKNVVTIVRTKISTEQLDTTNYISTNNMLPNYSGITIATNVPSGTATRYHKYDILLSNIRPYFKKVWFSDRSGGCNADIICIRVSNEKCVPQYLYYQLITDNFINNYVKACKGAKMPRGDLNQLLEYDFYCPSYEEQLRITNILGSIDKKIEINKKKIEKLEAINATTTQYIIRNTTTKRYKLKELAEIYQPKTISENQLVSDGLYCVYGANGIVGKYTQYNHVNPEIALTCRGSTCGNIYITRPQSWITGNAMVISPFNRSIHEFLFQMLKICGIKRYITGSAQPQITRTNIENAEIILPQNADSILQSLLCNRQIILHNEMNIAALILHRETILPLLMNGQVVVR